LNNGGPKKGKPEPKTEWKEGLSFPSVTFHRRGFPGGKKGGGGGGGGGQMRLRIYPLHGVIIFISKNGKGSQPNRSGRQTREQRYRQ